MIDVIYVEQAVRDHPRARAVLGRFPAAQVIECDHYGEIFNRHNQSFRLQKQRPALLLAEKTGRRILPVPDGYGLDGADGYYFSHILNCLYDCRYCFLQGLFRSAHYVLFVNYEDFIDDITDICVQSDKPQWFFSGYDCDSLALEPISAFTDVFIAALNAIPNAWLELRSKSTQIRALLDREPVSRVVCAFSLNPQRIIDRLEHRAPTLDARLAALLKLQRHGWPVALRFDPLILGEHFRSDYAAFFRHVFALIDVDAVHSITLGSFRAPRAHFRRMADLYPDETLFAQAFDDRQGQIGYAAATEREMLAWCQQQLAPLAGSIPVYLQSA